MGMLDFSEFGTSKLGYQKQLEGLSTDLIQAMRLREERKKNAQEASYRNAQIAHQNQQLQRLVNQDAERKKHEDLTDAAALEEKVHALLAAGDEEGARALIAARGGQNPAPGPTQAAGPPPEDLTLGSAAPPDVTKQAEDIVNPPALDASPAPPAALPSTPPEGAGDIHLDEDKPAGAPIIDRPPTAAEIRPMTRGGLIEAMRARHQQQPQVAAETSAAPEEASVRAFSPSTQASAETAPPAQAPAQKFTYITPDGRTVSLDAEQVRSGEMRRRAKEFYDAEIEQAKALHQSAAGQPPEVAAATRREAKKRMEDAARLRAHIESGAVAVKEAGVQAELGIRGRATQEAEDARNRYTQSQANYRAQLMANRREVDAATKEADKDRSQNRQEAQYVDNVTKDFRDKVVGLVPKDLSKYRELRASVDKIKGNPLEQKGALYALGKEINGPGVFTNQDRNDILNYGGLYDKIGNWFSQLQDGTLSDQYAAIAAQAIDHQLKKVKARVDAASADWDERFNDDPDLQTPEAKARLAVRKRGLFGAWGAPQSTPVPRMPPGAAVIGSEANPSGRSRSHTSSTRTKTKGPGKTGDEEFEDILNGH